MSKLSSLYTITPTHTQLNLSQAVWWVCFLLKSGGTYHTDIKNKLQRDYPNFKLSSCILDQALSLLRNEKLVTTTDQPTGTRGAKRKIYAIAPAGQAMVTDFANLWSKFSNA